ncbi:MAG: hypothetical protein HY517_04810 [Candidatus Aenigmarchaeota archaeon]|nr:hypothetical protein [Candidatus Aenigmarchaeota archaeon]
MNTPLTVWGIVLLVVFAGAHYLSASFNAAWLWVAVAIIIILLNAWVGKQMKGSPKGSKETWMSLSAFGFLSTLAVASGLVPVDVSWLMSLWLLLIGAALFSEGHSRNNQMNVYSGAVIAVASLFVSGFGSWYFMAGALFLGLLGLINGLLAK